MSLFSSKLRVYLNKLVDLESCSLFLKILYSENWNGNVTINSGLVLISLPFYYPNRMGIMVNRDCLQQYIGRGQKPIGL